MAVIQPEEGNVPVKEETPVEEPIVQPEQPKTVEQIVREAARKHGISEDHFVSIAMCESTMNSNAVNTNYYENGHPSGLFQHISGYWPARAAKYGYAGASVFDATANANVTAAMFKEGNQGLWECK